MLALIAVIVLLIDVALGRAGPIRWLDFALLAAAAILSLVNVFVHTRDAWTSVVPTGITLSLIVTILLLVAGLRGWCVTAIRATERGRTGMIITKRRATFGLLTAALLAGCSGKGGDPSKQYGPNPYFPTRSNI